MATKGVILASAEQPPGTQQLGGVSARQLLPIANKPILYHALEGMRRAGIDDVAIVTSDRTRESIHDAVGPGKRWGLNVAYLPQRKPVDVPAALLAAEEFVGDDAFVVEDGDGLLRDDLGAIVLGRGELAADAMLLVHRGVPSMATADSGAPGPGLALTGAHVFGPDFMRRARRRLRHACSGLAPLIDELRRDGARVEMRLVRDWHRFAGNVEDLLAMNRAVLDELEQDGPTPDLPDCQISGRVAIHPTAHVESTVIRGPAVIGAGATLVHAYVGPHTAIGENARVEGAEVEHSIVLAGATIMNVGGRVEASFVGRDARIFRDFSVPRALRVCIGDGARVGLL